jgi:hypothetical protein
MWKRLQLHVRRTSLDGFRSRGHRVVGRDDGDGSATVGSWTMLPLTVAAVAVCWLLAWVALLVVFAWLVRRRADAATLRALVRLAQAWRMPGGPFKVLEDAGRRRDDWSE